jgi:lysozyme family protein
VRPFLYAWQFMFVAEGRGKYHDVPGDPGGPTKWGITLVKLRELRGPQTTAHDVENLSESEAREIFRTEYWEKVRADELDGQLALAVVDAAFNTGPWQAIIHLQRAAQVHTDGKFGPATMRAVKRFAPSELLVRFLANRTIFYSRIPDPSGSRFGWYCRLFRVHRAILSYEH